MVGVGAFSFWAPLPSLCSPDVTEPHRNRGGKNGGNLSSNLLFLRGKLRPPGDEGIGSGHTASSGPWELRGAHRDQHSPRIEHSVTLSPVYR